MIAINLISIVYLSAHHLALTSNALSIHCYFVSHQLSVRKPSTSSLPFSSLAFAKHEYRTNNILCDNGFSFLRLRPRYRCSILPKTQVPSATSLGSDEIITSSHDSKKDDDRTIIIDNNVKVKEDDEIIIQRLLKGKHKWLGGAVDNNSDGSVYGIPSNSKHVICLSPPLRSNLDSTTASNDIDVDVDVDDSSSYEIHMLPLLQSILSLNTDHNGYARFQWLRGIITNGTLYGIPSWSRAGVLMIDIVGWRKWRENHPNDKIVPEIDAEQFVSVLPLPETTSEPDSMPIDDDLPNASNDNDEFRWMWHGASLNQNSTAIYCIPSNARQVLKVDLVEMSTSYLSIPPPTMPFTENNANNIELHPQNLEQNQQPDEEHESLLNLTNKWYGGILGDDNAIYGIPYASGSVLRIDANSDKVSLLGNFGTLKYNWHGGIKSPKNGGIYAFPAHSEMVLKIDTRRKLYRDVTVGKDEVGNDDGSGRSDEVDCESIISLLPIHRAPYDVQPITRYKWLGGSLGYDGCIYGMPSDASSVLRIDVASDIVTTFGWVERSSVSDENEKGDGYYEKNKWQGGVLGRDGHIYAVPSNARGILRIDTRPDTSIHLSSTDNTSGAATDDITFMEKERVTCIGNLPESKDKWQGGFVVKSGSIYGVPENCNRVLKVLPPLLETIANSKHSDDDVAIRML